MNHTVKECYSKHGYPPQYKQRNDYNKNSMEKGSKQKREQQVCNLNIKEDSSDKQTMKDEAIKGFTTDQMQKLLKLQEDYEDTKHSINQMQKRTNATDRNPQGKNLWILDTGQNKDYFTTFFRIKPMKIKLPNDNIVTTDCWENSIF